MKKKIVFIITILIVLFCNKCYAETEEDTEEINKIIDKQTDNLNISSFIEEAEKYKSDVLEDIDISTILSEAIKGNVNSNSIGKKILNIFFKEALTGIATIASIIVIIIIHSILKSISDGLENKSTSQITYYVTYILIVTIVMKSFADIIVMIKSSIESLVGFMNCLLPILITLMLATGSITSATMLQPMILFIITLTGNIITKLIIPFALISIALSIIANISDKIQINKLSKFINSTTIWVLGVILTVFVGISSLEGSITSGVDGLTVKTTKAAVSNFIPVVGKILRRCSRNSSGVHECIKKCCGNSRHNCNNRNMYSTNNKAGYTYGNILYRSSIV